MSPAPLEHERSFRDDRLQDWADDAACREYGLALFFPDGPGQSPKPAKQVCAGCDVRDECLAYALSVERQLDATMHGIWGGLTRIERRELRVGEKRARERARKEESAA